MKISAVLATSALVAAVSLASAEDEFCGQWNSTKADDYIVYNNLWGAFDDPAGTQCTGLDSVDRTTVRLAHEFRLGGAKTQVKSYANVALQFDHLQISDVASIPSTIQFKYDYEESLIANVAYDLFMSSTPDGEAEYEIMVWLVAIGGAGPISSTGSAVDQVTVEGGDFSLYNGKNGNMTVQYLINVQAGTEPFVGNGTFTVSKYLAAVKTAEYSQTPWRTLAKAVVQVGTYRYVATSILNSLFHVYPSGQLGMGPRGSLFYLYDTKPQCRASRTSSVSVNPIGSIQTTLMRCASVQPNRVD
ncbi:unnamed protein product [Phytophthora fragariaefolia]|uniref:Unnamed protein product n=1 Tax=Phytophthora fragariaefolia TaxID=1490495 RepID=A0A9W6TZN8_9STRA|nr:unnamed protein product [Phytophthora fragariaefolia]